MQKKFLRLLAAARGGWFSPRMAGRELELVPRGEVVKFASPLFPCSAAEIPTKSLPSRGGEVATMGSGWKMGARESRFSDIYEQMFV